MARKLIDMLRSPFCLGADRREARIGISIGIAIYSAGALEMDALIKAADTAMYDAKAMGNWYRFSEA